MSDLAHTITTILYAATFCGLVVYAVMHVEKVGIVMPVLAVLAPALGLAVKSPIFGGNKDDDKP